LLLGERDGADPGVAHHGQQIGEIVIAVAQEARPAEHPLECVLNEILRVLRRAAQRIGRAVEPTDMV
jgi:hypothetical protein